MGITTHELRIGNYITKSVGTVYRVEGVLLNNVFTESYSIPAQEFNSIALTEEWLLKFGFEKKWDEYQGEIPQYHKFPIVWQSEDNYSILGHWVMEPAIKYVHQLQNLYFALTGKELEVTK